MLSYRLVQLSTELGKGTPLTISSEVSTTFLEKTLHYCLCINLLLSLNYHLVLVSSRIHYLVSNYWGQMINHNHSLYLLKSKMPHLTLKICLFK